MSDVVSMLLMTRFMKQTDLLLEKVNRDCYVSYIFSWLLLLALQFYLLYTKIRDSKWFKISWDTPGKHEHRNLKTVCSCPYSRIHS